MVSMCFATLGWGVWWVVLVVAKLWPEGGDAMAVTASVVSDLCALLGLFLAAVTLRARRTWILFVMIPLFANASLLAMPWLV
jgi:hypothetical protein